MAKKKTQKRSRRNKAGSGLTPQAQQGLALMESQFDAFSPAAKGAKQLDNSSVQSGTHQERTFFFVTTDANGSAQFNTTPLPNQCYREATTIVGGTVTVDGSYVVSQNEADIDDHAAFRIVSHGVKIKTVAPGNSISGTMRINTNAYSHDESEFSNFSTETELVALQSNMSKQWLAKPRGTHIHDFLDHNINQAGLTAANTVHGLPFTVLDAFVMGGPASTVLLSVEVVTNYETIPDPLFYTKMVNTTKAWPPMASVHKTVSHMASQHPSLVDEGKTFFKAAASGAASSLLSKAFNWGTEAIKDSFNFGAEAAPLIEEAAPLMLLL